jgi:hypothetical protein
MNNCKSDAELRTFFLDNINGCNKNVVLEDFEKWKISEMNNDGATLDWAKGSRRMVSAGYKITDIALSHHYDLECFSARVEELFRWFKERVPEKKYLGPYLCFVQSSGMGKTKLMYEYKRAKSKPCDKGTEEKVAAFLILSAEATFKKEEEKSVFDYQLDLEEEIENVSVLDPVPNAASKQASLNVTKKLDEILADICKKNPMHKRIVLLFDESQSLLEEHFDYEAFLFRCVRMWLREKRDNDIRVVGVFAGTNSRLANFIIGSDSLVKSRKSISRDHQLSERGYHDKGYKFNPPFYQTATMGSMLCLLNEHSADTEYSRAVFYGRPLFAVMRDEGILDDTISTVLLRMLLSDKNILEWDNNRNTLINLLSTRVQLGQTTIAVTSELVAKAYANLSGYFVESVTAQMTYFPDPVCARLAMCMMDEDFACTLQVNAKGSPKTMTIKGKNKLWWTSKLKEIFSSGIVSPEKGDFGEVIVALYMLFCADLLRKRSNDMNRTTQQTYTKFSVSLDEWLDMVELGGKLPYSDATLKSVPSNADNECNVSVGFIQVCRNSLRSYGRSWKSLSDQSFLKHVYESGSAFYVYPGCPLIDMVIPLSVETGGKFEFVPMLVSIKCRLLFSKGKVSLACEEMKKRAKANKLTRALCLLIIFGSEPKTTTGSSLEAETPTIETPTISKQLTMGIVTKAIFVPNDDIFGLSRAFNDMATTAQVHAELFSSHPFLMAHGAESEELDASKAMRSTSSKSFLDIYKRLRNAVTGKEDEKLHNS